MVKERYRTVQNGMEWYRTVKEHNGFGQKIKYRLSTLPPQPILTLVVILRSPTLQLRPISSKPALDLILNFRASVLNLLLGLFSRVLGLLGDSLGLLPDLLCRVWKWKRAHN